MKGKAAEPESDWKDGFLFLGNQLALDFINTRPVERGETLELLPDFDALVRWFRAAGLLSANEASKMRRDWGNTARAHRIVDDAKDFREKLRTAVIKWEAGIPISQPLVSELNRLMAEHPVRTRLVSGQGKVEEEDWFEIKEPDDLLAPLARAAAALFANVNRDRVRKCGECVLYFQDTSKKGTRRWCSMRLCGNRLKVAAYSARQRPS